MRAIPYNDGGQFRHSDFVAYLPDFLKTEPDVVEFVQVLGDYINNAYRSLRTTTEFEIVRVCSETDVYRMKRTLTTVKDMFEHAMHRSSPILLLSAPRNNARSNLALGNTNAEYPVEIRLQTEKEDTVKNASLRGLGKNVADGQVVYVEFVDGSKYPYYYDRSADTLIVDPMGTSQDPFDGSVNTTDTVVSIVVDDVANVYSRYLKTINNINYYEVFFRFHVSSVDRVPVTGANGELVVDYMNYLVNSGDNQRTSLVSTNGSGYSWKNGFPTGMFYMRDMSSANIVNLSDENGVMAKDPALTDVTEKCSIETAEYASGVLTLTFKQLPTIADGAIAYLVLRKAPTVFYEFKMNVPDPANTLVIDGMVKLNFVPTKACDVASIVANISQYDFIQHPLFESYWTLDYEHPSIAVKWNEQLPLCGSVTVSSQRVSFRQYNEAEIANDTVAKGYIPSAKLCSGDWFYLENGNLEIGDPVYSGDTMWEGVVLIRDKKTGVTIGGIEYTQYFLSEGTHILRSSFGKTVDIVRVRGGIIKASSDGRSEGVYAGDSLPEDGDYLLLTSVKDPADRHFMQVSTARVRTVTFECSTLSIGETYFVTRLIRDNGVFASGVKRYAYDDTDVTAVLDYVTGLDIVTAKWLLATDSESGAVALLAMSTGVKKETDVLTEGDLVYVRADDQINELRHGTLFADKLARRAFSYVKVPNQFIPFYGQYDTLELGEEPDYSLPHDVLTSLTYIRKVNTTGLKYGWEDREWLYHGDELNVAGEHRNGFVEFLSSSLDSDIVNSDLSRFKDAVIDYPIVKSGISLEIKNEIDSVMAVNNNDGTWTVTVNSASHGLVDGCMVDISGIDSGDADADQYLFNLRGITVSVVDNDVVSYTVETDRTFAKTVYDVLGNHGIMLYDCSYRYRVAGVRVSESTLSGFTFLLRIEAVNGEGAIHVGRKLVFRDCAIQFAGITNPVVLTGEHEVIADPDAGSSDTDKYICIAYAFPDASLAGRQGAPVSANAYICVPPAEDDIVVADDKLYRVTPGAWQELDPKSIIVPCTIYAQQNLFDTSETNPASSLGDVVGVRSIRNMGDGKALVELSKSIPYLSKENARFINDRMEVYISNVYPTEYNGWHTVTEVKGGSFIVIRVNDNANGKPLLDGSPVDNRQMELRPGTWYKYTVAELEWGKISHCATYSMQNLVTEAHCGVTANGENAAWTYIMTRLPHRLSANDYIIVDCAGNGVAEMEPAGAVRLVRAVVTKVIDDNTFAIYGDCTGVITAGTSTAYRGYVLDRSEDNLRALNGAYAFESASYGNSVIRLRDGDVVVALAQTRPAERIGWRVSADSAWTPVRTKRVMKIRDVSVDMMKNAEYDEAETDSGIAEYKYIPHDHVSVMSAAETEDNVYVVPRNFARQFNFDNKALENLDTANNGMLQYSSKYDYGTIASRKGMDSSFDGIPDMGYPLAEKIERIAYLRDMSVIDYDLIGYLARFMGFDISGMDDNINENPLYNTEEMRRLAVRSVVENLPDIYAHSGTAAGMSMVMSLFGVVGRILTKWTETSNPYGELLTDEEVSERIATEGEVGSVWVPTPHIDLEIKAETATGRSIVGINSVEYLKDIIRVIKPIDVVFDKISVVIDATLNAEVSIVAHGGTLSAGTSPFASSSGEDVIIVDGPIAEDCLQ